MEQYIEGLSKAELDAFATEYFEVDLDRRKSKKVMVEQLNKAIEGTAPVKPLPFVAEDDNEELVVVNAIVEEEVETPEEIVEVDVSIDSDEEPWLPPVVEEGFEPAWELNLVNGDKPYANVDFRSINAFLAGDETSVDSSIESDLKTIRHWIAKNGEVLVRESANSRFVTLK